MDRLDHGNADDGDDNNTSNSSSAHDRPAVDDDDSNNIDDDCRGYDEHEEPSLMESQYDDSGNGNDYIDNNFGGGFDEMEQLQRQYQLQQQQREYEYYERERERKQKQQQRERERDTLDITAGLVVYSNSQDDLDDGAFNSSDGDLNTKKHKHKQKGDVGDPDCKLEEKDKHRMDKDTDSGKSKTKTKGKESEKGKGKESNDGVTFVGQLRTGGFMAAAAAATNQHISRRGHERGPEIHDSDDSSHKNKNYNGGGGGGDNDDDDHDDDEENAFLYDPESLGKHLRLAECVPASSIQLSGTSNANTSDDGDGEYDDHNINDINNNNAYDCDDLGSFIGFGTGNEAAIVMDAMLVPETPEEQQSQLQQNMRKELTATAQVAEKVVADGVFEGRHHPQHGDGNGDGSRHGDGSTDGNGYGYGYGYCGSARSRKRRRWVLMSIVLVVLAVGAIVGGLVATKCDRSSNASGCRDDQPGSDAVTDVDDDGDGGGDRDDPVSGGRDRGAIVSRGEFASEPICPWSVKMAANTTGLLLTIPSSSSSSIVGRYKSVACSDVTATTATISPPPSSTTISQSTTELDFSGFQSWLSINATTEYPLEIIIQSTQNADVPIQVAVFDGPCSSTSGITDEAGIDGTSQPPPSQSSQSQSQSSQSQCSQSHRCIGRCSVIVPPGPSGTEYKLVVGGSVTFEFTVDVRRWIAGDLCEASRHVDVDPLPSFVAAAAAARETTLSTTTTTAITAITMVTTSSSIGNGQSDAIDGNDGNTTDDVSNRDHVEVIRGTFVNDASDIPLPCSVGGRNTWYSVVGSGLPMVATLSTPPPIIDNNNDINGDDESNTTAISMSSSSSSLSRRMKLSIMSGSCQRLRCVEDQVVHVAPQSKQETEEEDADIQAESDSEIGTIGTSSVHQDDSWSFEVNWPTLADQTYYIVVSEDHPNSVITAPAPVDFQLTLQQAVSNNICWSAKAVTLDDRVGVVVGSNAGATRDQLPQCLLEKEAAGSDPTQPSSTARSSSLTSSSTSPTSWDDMVGTWWEVEGDGSLMHVSVSCVASGSVVSIFSGSCDRLSCLEEVEEATAQEWDDPDAGASKGSVDGIGVGQMAVLSTCGSQPVGAGGAGDGDDDMDGATYDVAWSSQQGARYFIHVSSPASPSTSAAAVAEGQLHDYNDGNNDGSTTDSDNDSLRFRMTVRSVRDNDVCLSGQRLDASQYSVISSSTRYATIPSEFTRPCGDASAVASPGVWYSVVGSNSFLRATTCQTPSPAAMSLLSESNSESDPASLPSESSSSPASHSDRPNNGTACDPACTFDAQITVLEGHCRYLRCIAGNDDDSSGICGKQSSVVWYGVKGEVYHVLVHGKAYGKAHGNIDVPLESGPEEGGAEEEQRQPPTTAAETAAADYGDFTLDVGTITTKIGNDNCEDAVILDIGSVYTGSTGGTQPDRTSACGFFQSDAPGVWFTMRGNGKRLVATTCDPYTQYGSAVTLFKVSSGGGFVGINGGCETLQCVNAIYSDCRYPSGSSGNAQADQALVEFDSEEGAVYKVLVHGKNKDFGLFRLRIGEATDNDACGDATAIDVDVDVDVDGVANDASVDLGGGVDDTVSVVPISGSTFSASVDASVHCQSRPDDFATYLPTPSVWYRLTTSKAGPLTVSACPATAGPNEGANLQAGMGQEYLVRMDVYRGDCAGLECVGGNELSTARSQSSCDGGWMGSAGNAMTSVTWSAAAEEVYLVKVSGFLNTFGSFELFVTR